MRLRLVASLGPAESPIPAFLAFSLVAHVLFAITVMWISSGRSHISMEPTMTVMMLGGEEPGGGPGATAEAPPQPEPEPEPEAEAEPEPVAPEPEPEGVHAGEEPEKIEEPERKPDPVEKPKPKPPSPTPRNEDPPKGSPTTGGSTGGGSGSGPEAAGDGAGLVGAMQGIDSQFNWYTRQVQAALYREWTQPPLSTSLREPVTVTVQFEIQRNGAVTGVQLASSSGIAVMDRSVLRAMANATLPPLPPAMRVSSRAVTVNFTLNPDET